MAINHKDRMYSIKSSIAEWKLRGSSDDGSLLAIDDMEWLIEQLELSRKTKADEAKRVADLLHTLNGDSYNSVRETLALMTEGEGDDPSVYQDMAGSALFKLDKALRVYERGDT